MQCFLFNEVYASGERMLGRQIAKLQASINKHSIESTDTKSKWVGQRNWDGTKEGLRTRFTIKQAMHNVHAWVHSTWRSFLLWLWLEYAFLMSFDRSDNHLKITHGHSEIKTQTDAPTSKTVQSTTMLVYACSASFSRKHIILENACWVGNSRNFRRRNSKTFMNPQLQIRNLPR